MTARCCATYSFPVNVSVCPCGLDPMPVGSFYNMSDLLSSLLLVLPLIRQVIANPMLFFSPRIHSLMIPPHSSFQILLICSSHACSALKTIHHFLSISISCKCFISPLSLPLPSLLLPCSNNYLKMFEVIST